MTALAPQTTDLASAEPTPSPASPGERDTPTTEQALHMDKSQPVRLRIPAMNVNARLVLLGKQKNQDLVELPPPSQPGWYKKSVTPGQLGISTIIGYIRTSRSQPGVFAHLGDLQKGDRITVLREDGTTAVFRTDKIKSYSHQKFPENQVYRATGRAELRVITSGGTLHPDDPPESNVVVYAHLVDTRGD